MEFKDVLKAIAATDSLAEKGTVYGDGPENTEMVYPAIRYEKGFEEIFYADNLPYEITDRYAVTVIEEDPNTPLALLVRQLPMCSFNRFYVADNLKHSVYNIFY